MHVQITAIFLISGMHFQLPLEAWLICEVGLGHKKASLQLNGCSLLVACSSAWHSSTVRTSQKRAGHAFPYTEKPMHCVIYPDLFPWPSFAGQCYNSSFDIMLIIGGIWILHQFDILEGRNAQQSLLRSRVPVVETSCLGVTTCKASMVVFGELSSVSCPRTAIFFAPSVAVMGLWSALAAEKVIDFRLLIWDIVHQPMALSIQESNRSADNADWLCGVSTAHQIVWHTPECISTDLSAALWSISMSPRPRPISGLPQLLWRPASEPPLQKFEKIWIIATLVASSVSMSSGILHLSLILRHFASVKPYSSATVGASSCHTDVEGPRNYSIF